MASKFLTLQESVRDAADLYLSLKYPHPFLSATPRVDLFDTWIVGTKPQPLNCGEATVVASRYHPSQKCLKGTLLLFANVKRIKRFSFLGNGKGF